MKINKGADILNDLMYFLSRDREEEQKQLHEGKKALIREMNERFTEMREDTGRRFQFVQWLIVAVGSFLTLVMTLLNFFS